MLLTADPIIREITEKAEGFPPQVSLVLSAMEAAQHLEERGDRRAVRRRAYRVIASLRLFSDEASDKPRLLYTRDVNARSLGFITPHRLPLGYGGFIELPGPGGEMLRIHCTLLRCREAAPGWFDASVYFNREQGVFVED